MPLISQVIVHIPHSSREIPAEFRDQFLLQAAELDHELELMTDAYTDELFEGLLNTSDLVFPVSRLVVDPERFVDDADESMSERGMGVIYRRTSDQRPLRQPASASTRELLLKRFYYPHHAKLGTMTSQALAEYGRCLIIDGHSYPSRPLPYEIDASAPRPEICIGTDEFHTSDELTAVATKLFQEAGFDVAINVPFSGAIVPSNVYRKDDNVQSIMIEVRRDLYMDESTADKSMQFDQLRRSLRNVLNRLVDAFRCNEV
jgi:N-formylglutamate amidohydrolase